MSRGRVEEAESAGGRGHHHQDLTIMSVELLGKKVGDSAIVQLPDGNIEYKILEISK